MECHGPPELPGRSGGARSLVILAGRGARSTATDTNTKSKPSELKITDLRVATLTKAPMTCPLVRINTNQCIYGLGEVRNGASATYGLMLKSRLLGENRCNAEKIFRKIRQFGGQSRQAGGVCGVEMALWDLAGKAFNVPVYQMLGANSGRRSGCIAILQNRTIRRSTISG